MTAPTNTKHGPGRPRKDEYRPAKLDRWRPKEWTPVYEQIVVLSCGMNRSNVELGEMFGFTPQHVSNILNTPEASLVRRRVLETLREKVDGGIPKRLSDLADKATQRVAQIMYDDAVFERSPFAVVDRALRVLAGVGRLRNAEESKGDTHNNILVLSGEAAQDIRDGLRKSREARELHEVDVTPKELKAG